MCPANSPVMPAIPVMLATLVTLAAAEMSATVVMPATPATFVIPGLLRVEMRFVFVAVL